MSPAQGLNTSLPGWTVLILRRHVIALDQLTEAEALELGDLIRRVSVALKDIVGSEKTYVMQFAEHPRHSHVHFHVVPRMADLAEADRGANIFNLLSVADEERVTEAKMNAFATSLQAAIG